MSKNMAQAMNAEEPEKRMAPAATTNRAPGSAKSVTFTDFLSPWLKLTRSGSTTEIFMEIF